MIAFTVVTAVLVIVCWRLVIVARRFDRDYRNHNGD